MPHDMQSPKPRELEGPEASKRHDTGLVSPPIQGCLRAGTGAAVCIVRVAQPTVIMA